MGFNGRDVTASLVASLRTWKVDRLMLIDVPSINREVQRGTGMNADTVMYEESEHPLTINTSYIVEIIPANTLYSDEDAQRYYLLVLTNDSNYIITNTTRETLKSYNGE